MNPLVTIYITNHNYGKYLKQSIESVLSQSYKNFELLIIDDGSTDNSIEIIKNYELNPKIKVIFQKNKGLTISNNIALRISNGEFIFRLDADDFLHKDAIKNLMSGFVNKKIGLVFGDWYNVDQYGKIINLVKRHNFSTDVTLYDQPAHGACSMFRTEFLRKINGYDESISRQDGYELWLRFIENFEVNNINTPVFYYRQHSSSLTKDEKKLLDTRAEILEKHTKKYQKKNFKKFVAIVPVRGSNIDSRSKPFLKVGNKNLIDYTLDHLQNSKSISKIILTTPSQLIIDYVEANYKKVSLIKRSIESSRINSPITNSTIEALKSIKNLKSYDSFLLVSIGSPFMRTQLVDSAINIKKIFDVDTVIGLRESEDLLYKHNGSGMVPLQDEKSKLKLESEQKYKRIKGMILRDINDYFKTKNLIGKKIGHVIIDEEAAIRINSSLDLILAEALIKKNEIKN